MDTMMDWGDLLSFLEKQPGVGKDARKALRLIEFDDPGLISNALQDGYGGEEGREDLLSAVRRRIDALRAIEKDEEEARRSDSEKPRSRLSRNDPHMGLLTESERKRGAATEIILAEVASEIEQVRNLRDQMLGGTLLDERSAIDLLHSPALALLSPEEMRDLGAPMVGHTSKVDVVANGSREGERRKPEEGKTLSVFIDPPGTAVVREVLPWEAITWSLSMPSQDGRYVEARWVYQGSTLNEIREIAELLAAWFIWPPEEAAMFILTGDPPPALPISSRVRVHGDEQCERAKITLEIEPWLPAETVAHVYLAQQRKLVSQEIRAMGRRLDVFLFVTERQKSGKNLSLRHLVEEWDRIPGNKPYKGNTSSFNRDYKSARKALLLPYREKLLRPYSLGFNPRPPWMW